MTLLHELVVFLFAPSALLGFIANWLVVIATWRSRSLNRSFSLLTANQAFFNALHSTLCLFYVSPMILWDSEFLIDNSNYCGFVMLLCYDAAIHAHFFMTINRFSAVFLPVVYMKFFTTKWTKLLIFLSFLLSLTVISYFYIILPCRLFYYPRIWAFYFSDLPVCWSFSTFEVVIKLVFVSVFDVVMDMITIWKVRRIKKQMRRGQPQVAACQKKELDCLRQSFAQSLFGFLFPIIGNFIPMFASSTVVSFTCGMVLWCLLHSMDGVFVLFFNLELRKSLKPSGQTSVVVGSSVVMTDGKTSVKQRV